MINAQNGQENHTSDEWAAYPCTNEIYQISLQG